MGEVGDISKGAAGAVGINVEVAVGVPSEGVVVSASVIEPGVVRAAGDAVGGIAIRVTFGKAKLDLGIVTIALIGVISLMGKSLVQLFYSFDYLCISDIFIPIIMDDMMMV